MNNLIDIFCDVDDFCHKFIPVWEADLIANGTKKRRRQSKMTQRLDHWIEDLWGGIAT
jgi:hypothetical protein